MVTNETGSGALVFATSTTLVTPALGACVRCAYQCDRKLNGLGGTQDLPGAFSDEWAANHTADGVVAQAVAMATAGRNHFLGRGCAVNYQWAYIWLERAKLYPNYFSNLTVLNANAEAARVALIAAGGDPDSIRNYFNNPPVWNGPTAVSGSYQAAG